MDAQMKDLKLNMAAVTDRIVGNISNEESLKDVIPFDWNDSVLEGKETIVIGKTGIREVSNV